MATKSRLPRQGLVIGLVAVLVVVLGVVGFLVLRPGGAADTTADGSGAGTGANAAGVVDPPVAMRPLSIGSLDTAAPSPSPAGVSSALAGVLASPAVASLSGYVIDPATGTVLFDQNSAAPQSPASTMKLITGAAVLTHLDPQSRLVTKVVQGDEPGTVVFVGGGDVTLSARAVGDDTVYPGAPTVTELAAQVLAKGVPVTRIVLDTSAWSGSDFADGWLTNDINDQNGQGFITRMSPLMVDGDRLRPALENSGRTGTPALTAGKALALALGVPDVEIVEDGQAPQDAEVLGQVSSQPISVLLAQALENSDNILAEALGREVARAMGAAPSFEGVAAALQINLEDLGFDTTGIVIADASGLSVLDKVPTRLLAQVLAASVTSTGGLRDLTVGLPIAGASGTLAPRFKPSDPASVGGRGWVRAKTGSLESTYALAGVVLDVDGRVLTFAFVSNGVNSQTTRPAQDALATVLRNCGCA
ncbi:D-alanyl-D-alanine carboxypeptidase/D-alanyl-D-alanine-endopeptidase [Nakamurella deserti]|uniref:D-alanyl-D-alanine carboxypeptidase/D-alanyl-D-alanine endopeptidase n=1 Tax=Nakamurella deserti TaxID=2164074 RepID=UPI0013008502|nr:D-alanyl-D-alanine carboxypeptidase/D-alanyl-D-alanine-endopeptidase [Nakamurella deserti]